MPVPQPMRSSSSACTGWRVRASLRTSAIDRNMALGPQAKTWSAHERWPARRSVTGPRGPAEPSSGGGDDGGDPEPAGDEEQVLGLAVDGVAFAQGPEHRELITGLALAEPGGAAAADVAEDGGQGPPAPAPG